MKKIYGKNRKLMKATNEIKPAAPASVWGYRGCAGKGGKTTNSHIPEKKD